MVCCISVAGHHQAQPAFYSPNNTEKWSSNMNVRSKADDENTSPEEVDVIVLTDEPSSKLGLIEVTVAARGLLQKQNLQQGFLLGWHAMDTRDAIDRLVQSLSSAALEDCNPIATRYETQFGPVMVVTEACNDGVNRVKTRLSLPLEK
jgi:hypothetical protein